MGTLTSQLETSGNICQVPFSTWETEKARTSGCGPQVVALAPASPCDREVALPELNCTLFLLAGYAKYQSPYVWVRSNHKRLIKATSEDWAAKDSPLKLNSTLEWHQSDVLIWEIVAELVKVCTWPPPPNPFTLDMRYFKSLPLIERFLASGAMANFLQRIVIYGNRDRPYYIKVLQELETLNRFHVKALQQMQRQKLREMEEEAMEEYGNDSSLSNGE